MDAEFNKKMNSFDMDVEFNKKMNSFDIDAEFNRLLNNHNNTYFGGGAQDEGFQSKKLVQQMNPAHYLGNEDTMMEGECREARLSLD